MRGINRILSLVLAVSMIVSISIPAVSYPVLAYDEPGGQVRLPEENYVCDFTKLVKDGQDTEYGNTNDNITLDDYVTADLTYAGTKVGSDGVIYLTGPNNGKASSVKGSHVEFTAVYSGTVTFEANAFNYFIDGAYTGYNKSLGEVTVSLKKGQTLQIAQRIEGAYVKSVSFVTRGDVEEVSSLKISYMNGDTVIKELYADTDNLAVGDEYTYISNNYITDETGKIYVVGNDYTTDTEATILNKSTDGGENAALKQTLTLQPDNTITYHTQETPDIVFYGEWEDILGTEAGSCQNTRYIASGGNWTTTTKTVPFYKIPQTGNYQILLVGGPKKRGTAIYANESIAASAGTADDGNELVNIVSGTSNDAYGIYAAKTVELTAGEHLTIRGFGSSNTTDNIDYIAVRRVYKNEIYGADAISVITGGITEAYRLDIAGQNIDWSVNGVDGVTIDNNGQLTVSENAASGTAVITAKAGGASYTKNVVIEKAELTGFTLRGSEKISLGATAQYKAVKVEDQFGRDITDRVSTEFQSSDENVISIDENGAAKSVSNGRVQITVTVKVGGKELSKTATVNTVISQIIQHADGDSTVVDLSVITPNENISGYLVTTATEKGVLVKQTRVQKNGTVTVDSKNADIIEISPIFTYTNMAHSGNGYILPEQICDGRYNVSFYKADKNKADIYINEYLYGNDVDKAGAGRYIASPSEYKVANANITGGGLEIRLEECAGNTALDKVELEKAPQIVNRKTKITIIGGAFAAKYYGDRTNKDLGNNQSGWGQQISSYINGAQYDIVNLAGESESTKSVYENQIESAIQNSAKGDIILCECGYGDYKKSSADEMQTYMEKIAFKAEKAGIKLIFLTSPVNFEEEGSYSDSVGFAGAIKEKASELGSDVIDMASLSYHYTSLLYGSNYDTAKTAYTGSLGISSGTGISFAGATKYAELIAKELRNRKAIDKFNLQYEYQTIDAKGNRITCSMNDNDNFISYAVFKDDENVGVTILPDVSGKIYGALYDENGLLLAVRAAENIEKAQTMKFDHPKAGCKIKIMNWTDEMTPVCNASELIEVNDIQPVVSDDMSHMKYGSYDAEKSLDNKITYTCAMPYRYYLPQNYDSEKEYPVIMYLHGAGRRGGDNNDQLINGQYLVHSLLSEKYINNEQTECIVIVPQCPSGKKWVNLSWSTGSYNYDDYPLTAELSMAHDIIIQFTNQYNVDLNRIYIAGQSMGGYGTWRMAAEYPSLFAAAVPLCGGGPKDEKGAGAIAAVNMPVWAFHGSSDSTVPVSGSRDMVEALKAYGDTNVNYTELEGRNHEIQGEVFTETAAEAGLYEWLFSQSK